MKKYIFLPIILVLAAEALNPLHASSQDLSVTERQKIVVKPSIKLELAKPKVEMVLGESEAQKLAKAAVSKTSKRELIARERPEAETEVTASAVEYNLDQLRELYRAAASKFGIDWKLIEAVHQVETGKSTGGCTKSSAGATGPMQFLPSTFRHYANEGNDICALKDSVYAGASLLANGGADVGDIDSALYNYNHSMSYVNLVKSIMNSI
jgi:membrane-bound lytic murein transglycosylase B